MQRTVLHRQSWLRLQAENLEQWVQAGRRRRDIQIGDLSDLVLSYRYLYLYLTQPYPIYISEGRIMGGDSRDFWLHVQTISISQKKLQNQYFHHSTPHGSPLSRIYIYICVYLSVSLSLSLSLSVSIFFSFSLSLYISASFSFFLASFLSSFISFFLFFLSLSLSIYLPIYLSTYLPIYLSTYLPTYLPIYLSTYLPICLSIYLSFLSIYLSIYLSVYLSVYLPIYLSIWNINENQIWKQWPSILIDPSMGIASWLMGLNNSGFNCLYVGLFPFPLNSVLIVLGVTPLEQQLKPELIAFQGGEQPQFSILGVRPCEWLRLYVPAR